MIRVKLTDGAIVEYPRANAMRAFEPWLSAVVFKAPGTLVDEVIAVLKDEEVESWLYVIDGAEVHDAR